MASARRRAKRSVPLNPDANAVGAYVSQLLAQRQRLESLQADAYERGVYEFDSHLATSLARVDAMLLEPFTSSSD